MKINFSAISSKITREDILEYKGRNGSLIKFPNVLGTVIGCLVVLLLSVLLINFTSIQEGTASVPYQYLLFIIFIFFTVIVGFAVKNKIEITRRVRLQKFAKTNGFEYSYKPLSFDDYKGMIFLIGSKRSTHDVIYNKNGILFEIGSHDYVVGGGKNQRCIKNGFIKIKLNRQLPHMVLDSKKNNTNIFGLSVTNLPISFKKDQVLLLEGDFNSLFTLYAPKKYERDALYVFSPDLMALFVDNVYYYDAEIIDDSLYIYSEKPFNLLDISLLEKIFKIIDLIGHKTVSRTKRYSDDRGSIDNLNTNIINKSGRRLKMKLPLSLIISTLILVFMFIIYIFMHYLPSIFTYFL